MSQLRLGDQDKVVLLNRLKRAEGQMRGVQRMMTAVRSALRGASLALARAYATQCLAQTEGAGDQSQVIDSLLNAVGKLP